MKNMMIACLGLLMLVIGLNSCQTNEKNGKTCQELFSEEPFPPAEKWTLIIDTVNVSAHGPFPKSGYVNEKGDTVVPLDMYRCMSDTFEYYGLVQDIQASNKFFGVDKSGKKLFEAVPDGEGFAIEEYEGRIMIQKDGKYGFANHKGEIIIEPVYACALSFQNGKAKVSQSCTKSTDEHLSWESNQWIFIDKCGNKIVSQ